jgi:hypothetical protein
MISMYLAIVLLPVVIAVTLVVTFSSPGRTGNRGIDIAPELFLESLLRLVG